MVHTNRAPSQVRGITGFGAYIPRLRIPRSEIVEAHRWMLPKARADGEKAFCSWDEDAVTMAVEAARAALSGCTHSIDSIALASTTMPNADMQHSAVIASVAGLNSDIRSRDLGFSQRAGTSAFISEIDRMDAGVLLIASDNLLAKPASPDELWYGAGAAALTLGSRDILARFCASESTSSPMIDHFRKAGSNFDYHWEERWVRDEGYAKVVTTTISRLLEKNEVDISDVKFLACGLPGRGAASTLARQIGFCNELSEPLKDRCGFAGVADPLLNLIGVLERANAGDLILVVGFGQGCDAIMLEAMPALETYRSSNGLAHALQRGVQTHSYLRMLSFQGIFEPDWGMRSEKEVRTALTELYRSVDQIWKFEAGRCSSCGTLQFPQLAYCVSCQAPASQFTPCSLADKQGNLLTYTADWLTYHPSPPLCAGFVQFGNELRLLMEIVDVDPESLSEGLPVRMVFRIKDRDKLRGWTRYFWKATPVLNAGEDS